MYHITTVLFLAKGARVSMLASDDTIDHVIVALRHSVVKDEPHRLQLNPKRRRKWRENTLIPVKSFIHKVGRKGAHLTYTTKLELGGYSPKKRYVLHSPTV